MASVINMSHMKCTKFVNFICVIIEAQLYRHPHHLCYPETTTATNLSIATNSSAAPGYTSISDEPRLYIFSYTKCSSFVRTAGISHGIFRRSCPLTFDSSAHEAASGSTLVYGTNFYTFLVLENHYCGHQMQALEKQSVANGVYVFRGSC